ncbi:MAG: efflux RND transporter periplasmic adaptor subunit [Cyclobacteriaceae bacterium]
MNKRKIFIILGVVILAGTIFLATSISSDSSSKTNQKDSQSAGETAVVVDTKKADNQVIETFIDITGRLQPEEKIDIFAEVSGVLQNTGKPFKEGVYYRRGQVLVRIDDDEAQQDLNAQKNSFINSLARIVPDLKIDYPEIYEPWKDYMLDIDMEENLPPLPQVKTDQQKLFLTGRDVYTQYYNIKQLESRLDKYVIRAPFNGTITEVAINQGTLVRSMQKLGEFVKTGVYELEAAVNIDELPYIETGKKVELQVVKGDTEYEGTIARINERVNQQTQTVEVFIRVYGENLLSGMYLEGKIPASEYSDALRIPRESLLKENMVYIIRDSTATLQPVEVLKTSEKEAIVKGLPDGSIIITEEQNAAFEGTKVSADQG